MSSTETQNHSDVLAHQDIIEHETPNRLPVSLPVDAADEAEASSAAPNKRERARAQRAELLREQAKLQQLLDEIEDDGDADIAELREQVADLKQEVANWQAPENPHSVMAQIGLFALAASLICYVVAPLFASASMYLDGALSAAAVLLGYLAAALLLFAVGKSNAKSKN